MSKGFDDSTLIAEIKKGNYQAFEQIFKAHQPYMVMYAKKFVDDWESARDLVQEIFLQFWENRGKVEITISIKAYLFKSVKNQCANYIKHKIVEKKYNDHTQEEFKALEIKYYQQTDEHFISLIEKELGDKISEAIESLPDQCRTTFELSRFQGLKSQEIAKKMDVSVRTVETQIYRALKVLKESLKDFLVLF